MSRFNYGFHSSAHTDKPQTLLFSATLPPWVMRTAKKYMSEDRKIVDLIGDQELKASETVEVIKLNTSIAYSGCYPEASFFGSQPLDRNMPSQLENWHH